MQYLYNFYLFFTEPLFIVFLYSFWHKWKNNFFDENSTILMIVFLKSIITNCDFNIMPNLEARVKI